MEKSSAIVNPWRKNRQVIGVLGILIGACGVMAGVIMQAWDAAVGMALLGIVFATGFYVDYPYAVLSEAGVAYRIFLRRRFLPWSEFRQAGVCLFETKKPGGIVHNSYKLGLLLPKGTPKKPGQRISYYKNIGRIIYLPDTPEIRDFVIAHYGLLDFDESVDPRGYSVVVD